MGVDTVGYLIMPKLIAALFVIPMLAVIAATLGMLGGMSAVVASGEVTSAEYLQGIRAFFVPYNVFIMTCKSYVFAFILTTVSSYQGYYVTGGSIELGKASTNAVVFSNVLILLSDYLITLILT